MERKLRATYGDIECYAHDEDVLKVLYKKVNSIKRELTDLYDLQQKKYKAEETKSMAAAHAAAVQEARTKATTLTEEEKSAFNNSFVFKDYE